MRPTANQNSRSPRILGFIFFISCVVILALLIPGGIPSSSASFYPTQSILVVKGDKQYLAPQPALTSGDSAFALPTIPLQLQAQDNFFSDNLSPSLKTINSQLAPSSQSQTNGVLSPTQTQSIAYNDTALIEAYPGNLNNRTPVILVHGLHGNRTGLINPDTVDNPNQKYFKNLIVYLNNSPNYNTGFKTYKFHWVSDKYTTRQIAEALRERIDERSEFANKEIIIITHSTGGLIARQYMTLRTLSGTDPRFTNRAAGERVRKLITLAAPHHGTYGANGNARVGNSIYYLAGANRWALYKLSDILYWNALNGCGACISNLQQPNRSSLLWDNFDGKWNNNLPYTTNTWEMNQEPIPPTYNHKIVVYWGEVSTSDTAWRQLLAAVAYKRKLIEFFSSSYTYGVGTDTQAALAAYLLQTIKTGSLSISTPQNDGLVPVESGRFDTPAGENWHLMGSVHCGGYNHRQLLDGSSRRCDNGKILFDSVLSDVLSSGFTLPAMLFGPERTKFGPQNYGTAAALSASSAKNNSQQDESVSENIGNSSEVELNNAGDSTLQVTSLSLTGNNPDQFSILSAPSIPFTIPAKSSVNVTVGFNPTSTGLKTATLQANNSSTNPVVTVQLEGFGMPASCDITLTPENRYLPVTGGNGSFTVPNISCPWSISTDDAWIHPTVIGNTVNFTVDSNPTGAVRSGQIRVSVYDRIYPFDISQGSSSSGCVLNLSASSQNFASNGGSSNFNVITPDTCGWGVQSGAPWITVTTTGIHGGSGTVNFTVTPNTGASLRYGTIIVEGFDATQTFIVSQDAGSNTCTYTLSASEQILGASGGPGSFSITTGVGCPWQVSSPDRWITITSANNGTGSRTITYTVAANLSTSRRLGDISVHGSTQTPLLLTVNQDGQPTVYPSISLPTSNFQMGDALLNTTIYQSVLIRNDGPGYLFLGSIYLSSGSADFDVLPYAQNQIIAPGGNTSITVKLTPASTGSKSATFSIGSNDPNRPIVNFSITGNGVTQITGGIDFVWSNKFTVPNQASISYVTAATINNNIYVVGGNDYKYDPTINSWNEIAQQPFAQYGAADVVNGKIYLVGYDPFSVTTRVVIYDPANNSWNTGATMPALRLDLAVAAANGKVYAFGGRDGGDGNAQPRAEVYEYNPSTNAWTPKTSMLTARMGAVAVSLNGLIYVIGGRTNSSVLNTVEVYNPATNSWATREQMPSRRAYTAAFIINSKIYVAGGDGFPYGGGNVRRDLVEEFDPSKTDAVPGFFNAWAARNPLLTGRLACAAGVVNNKAYVIGGTELSGTDVHTIEEGTLSAAPRINMPVRNVAFGAISIGNIGEKGLEVQNLGNALLTISSSRISGSGDFNIFRSTGSIDPGQSYTFKIRFPPSSAGSKNATFRITSNDPSNPTIDFTVSGDGIASPQPAMWEVVNSIPFMDNNGPPTRLAINNGKAYIARASNGSGGALTVLDLTNNTVVGNVSMSAYPNAQVGYVAASGNRAYVTLGNLGADGKLAVINTDSNSVLTYAPVGIEPFGVSLINNKLYVANNVSWANGDPSTVKVVDASNNTVVNSIFVGRAPTQVVSDVASGKVYVINNCTTGPNCAESDTTNPLKSLSVIDSTTDTVTATVPLPYNPNTIALANNRAYICTGATVEVVDLSSNSVIASIPTSGFSYGIAATPEYILVLSSDRVTVIKAATNLLVGSVAINSPSGIAFDPTTNLIYVTRADDRAISVLRFLVPAFSVSTNSQSLAAAASGNTTFSTTVTSIDGWTGSVTLSCEGLPTGGTCQFAQNPVSLSANGTVNTNVTINVPAGTVSGGYSLRVVGSGTGTALVAGKALGSESLLLEEQTDYNNLALTVPTASTADSELRVDAVTPAAGRASGGQQIRLTGALGNLTSVTVGGLSTSWSYTNGTSEITIITPPHVAGAVNIDLTTTSGSSYSKSNAFAYLPTVFTDDTLVAGVTAAKAQHIVELRQAVDALRAVAGLPPVQWTDPALLPFVTSIKAVHIMELRTNLEAAAAQLGYAAASYTDPTLNPGVPIKRLHIEELRQRLRTIAG